MILSKNNTFVANQRLVGFATNKLLFALLFEQKFGMQEVKLQMVLNKFVLLQKSRKIAKWQQKS